ncbi:hypothetical protein PVAND_014768 [Polypedilum vanderplanki]|uniref:NACHT domain-containing protein n=1 Tax=Polypedilum vanderplanki TaxID=319348 RepID=A0A9J6BAP4_POLVA|nr:hypothetical protein PVAND_014768 [Polypedilum vanderplanki]
MDITNSSISSITVEYNDQNVNFIQNQIPNNKINSFEISKCPSTDEAFKIISNDSFRSTILQKFPSLIALRIKIENNLEKIEVRKTEFQELSKFLLSFESMTENQIVVFFKNEGSEEFFKLSLLNNNVPTLVKYFAINFMIEALNNKNDKILFCSNQKFDLSTLINNSYRNLLIEAVHKNDLKLVQEILKLPIDVNWKIYKEVKGKVDFDLAIDIAWSRRNFQIVYELLNANSMYPKDFKEEEKEEAFDDIKNFYEISKDMFEAIQSNNKDKVLKVLEKKPYLRYFFNKSNTSAIKFAVREKTFEIYQILCEHNVTYGPDEPFKEICDPDFLKQISNYNSSIAKSLPEYHIMVLLSKSVLSQNDVNFHERLNSIKNAFKSLNLILEIKPVLQILAFDKKTKFIFDFTQNSIVYMNPALRELTKAAYIPDKHHIQIAAKMLLEDETKNETQASLAHECYHFGFDLVFMNERLPYENGDEKNQKKFQNLIEECKNLQASEPIIKEIFEIYKSPAFGRELAVRVPHMLAFYQNNPEKIKELKKIFKNLFDYHEKNVMPEIKAAVEFYKKFADESNEINFKDLTKPLKAAVKHSFVDFQEKSLKILEVFDDQMLENLSSKQIKKILDGQKLKIGKNLENIQNTFYKLRKFINTEFKGEILEYKKEEQKYKVTGLAKENTKNIDEIIAEVESSKIFILPDAAGAGKSTTMKFLAWKIKEKNWISVIDLKRHLKIYETYKNSFLKSNPTKKEDENIILKILLEILSISDDFEILFFSHLFTNGRVILFFDGVDEIAPKYENFFINLIINIKKLTNIQQWIATRPQHEKDIKEKVEHGIAYKFLPFDSKEVNLFITKYMRFKNINLDLKSIETVIENLKIYENVLMLTMIIELQIAGKLPIENINQYSLYEAMVEMKIDIVADKGSLVNRDAYTVSKMTLWEIHQIYAFKLLFEGEKFENFYSNKILKSQNFHYSDDENEKESKFVKFENFQMFKKWSRENYWLEW